MNRTQFTGILIVGMTLGTAWAVRGQFGHEQGAAWAGGIVALVLLLVARRTDWYEKFLPIVFSSAIGWGITGMISYGRVVGYGRSDNFPNAFYGLLMLFVIGGLFGLLGGGLTGLSLESTTRKRVSWGRLMAEMVAGALICYGLLVMQLGVLMTPPRSEAWAFSLGGGLAMVWYMARYRFYSSMRVALFTALGAGFGFAFGNFLQTLGTVLQISFNMWNVMEYSIGFFGGTAMAYTIFTSHWPVSDYKPRNWENRTALFFLAAFIPLIIFRESLQFSELADRLSEPGNSAYVARITSRVSASVIALGIIVAWFTFSRKDSQFDRHSIKTFFAGYFGVYILLSYLVTGALALRFHLNHHLYIVNYIVIFLLLSKLGVPVSEPHHTEVNFRSLRFWLFVIIAFIALLALFSIAVHEGLPGGHNRFER